MGLVVGPDLGDGGLEACRGADWSGTRPTIEIESKLTVVGLGRDLISPGMDDRVERRYVGLRRTGTCRRPGVLEVKN